MLRVCFWQRPKRCMIPPVFSSHFKPRNTESSIQPKIDFRSETFVCKSLPNSASHQKQLFWLFYGNFCWFLRIFFDGESKKTRFFPPAFDKSIEQTFLRNSKARRRGREICDMIANPERWINIWSVSIRAEKANTFRTFEILSFVRLFLCGTMASRLIKQWCRRWVAGELWFIFILLRAKLFHVRHDIIVAVDPLDSCRSSG